MEFTRRDFLKIGATLGGAVAGSQVFQAVTVPAAPVHAAQQTPSRQLVAYPPPESWEHWEEYDISQLPRKVKRAYTLVPTVCFNCEASCSMLAYVDKETFRIRKFEGNPAHTSARGRLCAKGPANLNLVYDPDRILYPLKRAGRRGEGKWQRISWDQALDEIAGKMRQVMQEGRRHEIMYHYGRAGEDGFMYRLTQSWGIDGINSHTNICSSGARFGAYLTWGDDDRPSPDFANARVIFLMSAHLESGHYFNPHAQRITEGRMKGAKLVVVDPRLSNTASLADYWLPTHPGTESALLLAIANVMIQEESFDREYVRRWFNWEQYMAEEHPTRPQTFEEFIRILKELYGRFTPEYAEQQTGVSARKIVEVAHLIAEAGGRVATMPWRNAFQGNRYGGVIARDLYFVLGLAGAIGVKGGTMPADWHKLVPPHPYNPPAPAFWNDLLYPKEWPLAFYEMSEILPHLLREQPDRKLAVYFQRVFNPVWTYPNGAAWIEMLRDESKVEMFVSLSPTWSESNWFADYILPMGTAAERHDNVSMETYPGRWVAFRQPVLRVAREQAGQKVDLTYQANVGEVWEEVEFWIQLNWKIDPDGSLGVRKWWESKKNSGTPMTMDEYWGEVWERTPGLKEKALREGLTPLQYMRKYGAYELRNNVYREHEEEIPAEKLAGTQVEPVTGVIRDSKGNAIGVMVDGVPRRGFKTPSRKLEFYSKTIKDFHWPEFAIPAEVKSHVHWENLDREQNEFALVPTFRLPTLIHTRGQSKWLYEISHTNPVWMNTADAKRMGLKSGDLIKVHTDAGYFVARVRVTEGVKPGVVCMSHHLGRWRLADNMGGSRWNSSLIELREEGQNRWRQVQTHGPQPFQVSQDHVQAFGFEDRDTARVWWSDAGVHQNFAFAPHPDPLAGNNAWHQKVRIERAGPGDRYGDVFCDSEKAFQVYLEWKKLTRPAPGPDGLRRPLWIKRPGKPMNHAYKVDGPTTYPDGQAALAAIRAEEEAAKAAPGQGSPGTSPPPAKR